MPEKNFDNTALGEQVLITIINSSKMFDGENKLADAITYLSDDHKKELENDISAVIKSYYQYKFRTWMDQPSVQLYCINGNTKPFQLDLLHELT